MQVELPVCIGRVSIRNSLRHFALRDFFFPLIHKRPVDRTGPKVSHMQVALQSNDSLINHRVIFAEHGPMTGQQPLHIACPDAL